MAAYAVKVNFIASLMLTCLCVLVCGGATLEEELTVTFQQKVILDKFRSNVEGLLTTPAMKTDSYLVKWLRATKFNLNESQRLLKNHLKWRQENNIDHVSEIDWSEFKEQYPYTTDVYDRDGRPTFLFNFGEWDIRRAAVTGKTQKMILYWAYAIEEMTKKVIKLQSEGKNVTTGNIAINVRDYNVVEHSCGQCIPVYLGLISLMRQHYPGDINTAYIINAPQIFDLLMQIIKPAIGETGDNFQIYGTNKRQWQNALYQQFEPEQLPPAFGGTNVNVLNV